VAVCNRSVVGDAISHPVKQIHSTVVGMLFLPDSTIKRINHTAQVKKKKEVFPKRSLPFDSKIEQPLLTPYELSVSVRTPVSHSVLLESQALQSVVGGLIVHRKFTPAIKIFSKPITSVKKIIDTAFSYPKFSVYPNPVPRGAVVKLVLKRLDQGSYQASIIAVSGTIIQSSEVVINNKDQATEININELAAGNYFIRLTNRRTGKYYTEKIIVQ
jgi:hypothetical protein